MSWPAIVMWLVVACVGLPASFRNPTALALTLSWLVGETAWLITGNSFPLSVYFMADVTVIAVIYAKTIRRCGAKLYSSLGEQVRCLVTDLTVCDRWVVAIFLLGAWPLYVFDLHPFYKWWSLWSLVIAQFLIAGSEVLVCFLAARREARKPPPIIDRHLVVIPFPTRVADAVRKPVHREICSSRKLRGHG